MSETVANSRSAISHASVSDVAAIEIDVRLLRDGTAVVFHDSRVNGRALRDMSLPEVKAYALANDESIPTLSEALELARGLHVVLELKDPPNESLINQLRAEFQARPASLTVISFSARSLRVARRALDAMHDEGTRFLQLGFTSFGLSSEFDGVDVRTISAAEVARRVERGEVVGVWGVSDVKKMRRLALAGVALITTDEAAACVGSMKALASLP